MNCLHVNQNYFPCNNQFDSFPSFFYSLQLLVTYDISLPFQLNCFLYFICPIKLILFKGELYFMSMFEHHVKINFDFKLCRILCAALIDEIFTSAPNRAKCKLFFNVGCNYIFHVKNSLPDIVVRG
jgi:hypothetical protein